MVIILCVGGTYLIENVPNWLETTEVNVCSEIPDANVAENILDNRYSGYRVKSKSDNYDIIFSTNTEPRNGYTLKEGILYTPMVMYVEANVDNHEGGFINAEGENNRKKINLHTVLIAMEKNQKWEDIGVSEKVVKDKITIYIPDEKSWFYPAVEDLFYLTINGGKIPTEEERSLLKERIDNIIANCECVPDIEKAIYDEYVNETKTGKVFIAPECLFLTTNGMSNSNNYNKFVPIYFNHTTFIYVNAYLRTSYQGKNIADGFISTIQNKKNFMYDTGWRVKDSTFDIHSISTRFIKVPT
jgi:hypothetical protein